MFDANGRELANVRERDPNGDGTPDSRETLTTTRDANGNPVNTLREFDDDGNGTTDRAEASNNSFGVIDDGLFRLIHIAR
jgi:hypothetical protein